MNFIYKKMQEKQDMAGIENSLLFLYSKNITPKMYTAFYESVQKEEQEYEDSTEWRYLNE